MTMSLQWLQRGELFDGVCETPFQIIWATTTGGYRYIDMGNWGTWRTVEGQNARLRDSTVWQQPGIIGFWLGIMFLIDKLE